MSISANMINADPATVYRVVVCSQVAVSVIALFIVRDCLFSVPLYEPLPVPVQLPKAYCVPELLVLCGSTLKIAVEPALYQPSPIGLP